MPLTRPKKVPTANLAQGSSFLTSVATSNMPAGSIIQVKHAFHGTNTVSTSTDFVSVLTVQFDNDLQTNSDVLVSASFGATRGTYNSNWGARVTFYRDSTNLGTAYNLANNSAGGIMSQDNTAIGAASMQHLDTTPGTGRPVYSLRHGGNLPNDTLAVQIGGNRTTTSYGNTGTMLTIMEIKG
tara:strand:- start:822 stop:1370 length:549 start_codon:yes stop_codon:yes gene_type:complete